MKNILTIKGQKYEINAYYEFESCLSSELDNTIYDFPFFDEATQKKILRAFDVTTIEELDKIDIDNFSLEEIIDTLGNLNITFHYAGIDFNGQIDPLYIDDYHEEEHEPRVNDWAYNGVNLRDFYSEV